MGPCLACSRPRVASAPRLTWCARVNLPQTLNLSLLRFVFDPNVGDRVKTKRVVRFPPSLDMRPFVTRGADVVDADDEDLVYDLRAVLVHKGESANSGHYCAQVCSSMCVLSP